MMEKEAIVMEIKGYASSMRALLCILIFTLCLALLTWLTGCATTNLIDAAKKGDAGVVRGLLDRGANVNEKDKGGFTPLHIAAARDDPNILRILLDRGANVNEKARRGDTALHMATLGDNPEMVRILLDRGANVNEKNDWGSTALHHAALQGHSDIAQVLLDRGANVDEKNSSDSTALHYAAFWGYSDIVQLLLDNGANVDAKDVRKATPMNLAAFNGHADVVHLLLNRAADPGIADKDGKTPLRIAEEKGYVKIASMLREAEEKRYMTAKKPIPSVPKIGPAANKPTVTVAAKKEPPKLPVMTSSLEGPDISQHWAVIVGVSDYQDSHIPSLRYAAADAQSFYAWLTSPEGGRYPPSRVKLMVNEQATGRSMREALFIWLKQAIEEDMVVIFFAGHGSPESPDSADNLFLLPYDTQYESIAATGFPMWDIETALKRFIRAKKVVVIADACHSGGVGEAFDIARRANRGIKVNWISSELQNLSRIGDGIAVISASDDRQFSQENKRWGGGHGVFTYFLLKGLKGEADYTEDKRITLGELIPYLSEQVRRATRNAQCPTVAGKFDPALSIGR
jgi:ankyrin repeat protein